MSKKERNFYIPKGTEDKYDELRDSLMDRIASTSNSGKINQNQTFNSAQRPISNNQSPFMQNNNSSSQYSRTYGDYRNINTNNYNNNVDSSKKDYLGFDQNPIPVQDPYNPEDDVWSRTPGYATATHSTEPMMYKQKKKKSALSTFFLLVLMVAIVFALSWFLREFVFQAYEIPSGSMETTIMTGDMVFAEKISVRFQEPHAGDIVTFQDPISEDRILIKRIIATGGQTIDIHDNKLYIDGVEQHENYTHGLPTTVLKSSKVSYPYKIPEDSIWVMGDNRTNSQDSRYFGAVPKDTIIGHALFAYWPIDKFRFLS